MRFSIAALAAMAAGATAWAPSYTTEVVTQYTTYCPEATSIVHSGQTWSMTTPGTLTMSSGPYTITRPLMTSTVTECSACSSTPAPSSVAATSTPYVPSASASATPSASPVYNAASRAATGAGAGLAAVFGAAALLL